MAVVAWRGAIATGREAVAAAGGVRVKGIGFAATCSLVCLDRGGAPVSVVRDGEPVFPGDVRNIVVWMDHRATAEAARARRPRLGARLVDGRCKQTHPQAAINATKHKALATVGGAVSPEMELPKVVRGAAFTRGARRGTLRSIAKRNVRPRRSSRGCARTSPRRRGAWPSTWRII